LAPVKSALQDSTWQVGGDEPPLPDGFLLEEVISLLFFPSSSLNPPNPPSSSSSSSSFLLLILLLLLRITVLEAPLSLGSACFHFAKQEQTNEEVDGAIASSQEKKTKTLIYGWKRRRKQMSGPQVPFFPLSA
jgi:hypothetical protein